MIAPWAILIIGFVIETPWFTLTESAPVAGDAALDSGLQGSVNAAVPHKRAFDRLNWSPFDFGVVKRSVKEPKGQKSQGEHFDSAYLPWFLP